VIIPNTDSELIGEIIAALEKQTTDLSTGEIIVVGADDSDLIGANGNVRFILSNHQIRHASDKRNIGMRAARGEIFLFLDDDCIPRKDWIDRHLVQHELGEKVVGGSVEFADQNYYQLADNISQFHDLMVHTKGGPRPYLASANLSVHRSVVERAGEMQAHKSRAEDLEWTVRFRSLGYTLYFEPRAIVFHDPPRRSFSTVWKHWIDDAPDTLLVRLRYANLLRTPALAQYRLAYIIGAPIIAAWATARTFAHPQALRAYWHTLPLVYLTKLAWCWSAYRSFPR
jgi:glycosyltransferase involved in cell wall biosynthesis